MDINIYYPEYCIINSNLALSCHSWWGDSSNFKWTVHRYIDRHFICVQRPPPSTDYRHKKEAKLTSTMIQQFII